METGGVSRRDQLRGMSVGIGLAIAAFCLSVVFGLLYGIPVFFLGFDLTSPSVIAGAIVAGHFGLLVIAFFYTRKKGLKVSYGVPSLDGTRVLVLGLLLTVTGTWILVTAGSSVVQGIRLPVDTSDPRTLFLLSIVLLFIAVPVEEYLFRGVIQRRIDETLWTPVAIVSSSVLFALLYLPNYLGSFTDIGHGLLLITFFGLVFGTAYERTGNLMIPIIIHAVVRLFLLYPG